MATVGPNFAGTGANNNDGGTTAWSNPTNAQGDTTSTAATVNIGSNGGTSQKLRLSNFGFSIPATATINGILVEIERSAANANRHYENNVQLLKAGTESGDNKSEGSAIPTTKAFKTYGGAADLWGNTLAPSDVNSSSFGVSFKTSRSASQTTTTSVYRVRITVTYTPNTAPSTALNTTDGQVFTTSTPTLSLTATDADSDPATLNVQINDQSFTATDNCYDFEESEQDRIDDFPTHADYTTVVAISFWINAESNPSTHQAIFVSKDRQGYNRPNIRVLWTPAGGGDIYVVWYSDDNSQFNEWKIDYSPPIGSWVHIYVEVDWTTNPDTVKIWINGVEQTVTFNFGSNNTTPSTTGTQIITLGGDPVGDPNNADCKMSDIGFWSDLGGATRAGLLYRSGKGRKCAIVSPSTLTEDIPLRIDTTNNKGGFGVNSLAAKVSGAPFVHTIIDAYSDSDAGYSGSPDNTDPFTSGQAVSYAVQPADALAAKTYYWRGAAKDPAGTNSYGSYATERTFIISLRRRYFPLWP